MELKEEDIPKIEAILKMLVADKHNGGDMGICRAFGLSASDFAYYWEIIKANDWGQADPIHKSFGWPKKTEHTERALRDGCVRALYEKQEEGVKRQREIDAERRISIRNKKWALPLSIISLSVALAALATSIIAACVQ
jgi:hypothetical protein